MEQKAIKETNPSLDWQLNVFRNFRLYGVTDLTSSSPDIDLKVQAAYRGGADIIQLRSKSLSDKILFETGLRLREMAEREKKLFFINDRLDLALALRAHGLHIGQDDLPVKVVRGVCKSAGIKMLVGKSTHSVEQALATVKEDVDYIGLGPVFKTPTKPDYAAIGPEIIRRVTSFTDKPVVVIGGIGRENIKNVLEAGARRVAVVRAIFSAGDVYEAAKELRSQIDEYSL